ncbi:MAG: Cobalamin B12-binding domain protein [Candidatus Yanofskybacteria bacterium GW2011_GWA2_44_9]|nr:MAG: Cobalamin B12-binding domain protein [Candidatus Yanofskybacteria bacterium GW2011_GWA2_44_9]
MSQVNYRYGDNAFLPYSVAVLQAYAQAESEIRNSFTFKELIFLREDPDQVARRMESPSILALSCYMWNWEWQKLLAQAVKAYYPDCLVIMGGIHIPEKSDGFFREYPYVDLIIHGEGEVTFTAVLLAFLSGGGFESMPGVSIRRPDNSTLKTSLPNRISDLSKLPSPYLTGVFDSIIDLPFLWNASQETNRGCPYPCTFCAWGPAYQQKVWQFSEDRIIEELEWFGRHRIEYIFNCDANWGIFERDLELTRKMAEIKARYQGYPKKFRMCTAKNSNDRVFDISRILDRAGMNKGATLSFQSMNDTVLEAVKRRNIKIKDFTSYMRQYREAKIATYTELIMGLPCETYTTFKEGIDKLINAGQHNGLNNYVCLMLPNDEMSDPDYVRKHRLGWVKMPILLAHSTPGSDPVQEYQDVVVSTNSMPVEDWERIFIFSWAVQSFHCLGLTQTMALFLRKQFGVQYSVFYEKLIDYFSSRPETLLGQQLVRVSDIVSGSIQGGRLDMVMPKFGEIYWPLEEAAFLNCVTDKETFYRELAGFVDDLLGQSGRSVDRTLLSNLLSYQRALVVDPYSDGEFSVNLEYDLHDYFAKAYLDEEGKLALASNRLVVKPSVVFKGDLVSYAREIVWYGRKGGKFYHSDVEVARL